MQTVADVARASHEAWNKHLSEVLATRAQRNHALVDRLIVFSKIPHDLAMQLDTAINAAPKAHVTRDAVEPGCIQSAYRVTEIAALNESSSFCVADDRLHKAYQDLLGYLGHLVAEILGSPWRVLNMRSWVTKKVGDGGPFGWHTDGGPAQMLKIMVYPSGGGLRVDIGDGKTQDVTGRGLWAMFYNSALHHQAIAEEGRTAVEITLVPSREFDLRPAWCGLNGKYPILP